MLRAEALLFQSSFTFVIYLQNYNYWQDFLILSRTDSKIQRLFSSKNLLLPEASHESSGIEQ